MNYVFLRGVIASKPVRQRPATLGYDVVVWTMETTMRGDVQRHRIVLHDRTDVFSITASRQEVGTWCAVFGSLATRRYRRDDGESRLITEVICDPDIGYTLAYGRNGGFIDCGTGIPELIDIMAALLDGFPDDEADDDDDK